MTPLRLRMIEELKLAGLSTATQRQYLQVVSVLAQQFGCSPEK